MGFVQHPGTVTLVFSECPSARSKADRRKPRQSGQVHQSGVGTLVRGEVRLALSQTATNLRVPALDPDVVLVPPYVV